MPDYEVGKFYELTQSMADQIVKQMGMGAMMMNGNPDLSVGRRYDGANPDRWSFWTTERQKVDVSVSLRGSAGDHFICGFGNGADPDCPEPQFTEEPNQTLEALKKAAKAFLESRLQPKKCIKPDCENLVAPIGTKKPQPGVFKNYAATGACQKGHNSYFCIQCSRPHSYASEVGKRHMAQEPPKDMFDLIADFGFRKPLKQCANSNLFSATSDALQAQTAKDGNE